MALRAGKGDYNAWAVWNRMAQFMGAAVAPSRKRPPHQPVTVVRRLTQELRQPLGAIESIAQYLNIVLPRTEAKARRRLAQLQEEVSLVRWSMECALQALEPHPLVPETRDLASAVNTSLSSWRPPEGVGVTLTLEPGLPPARFDAAQMEYLMRDLLVFAGRVCAPGRLIAITLRGSKTGAVLEVAAETVEYSAADLALVFNPLGSNFPAGAGLALAGARSVADAHGARLEMECAPPRRVTVRVAFPGV